MTSKNQPLLDEVILLGNQKEFSVQWIEAHQIFIPSKNFNKVYDPKRRAYCVSFFNILKKYNADTDTVFDELDAIWEKVKKIDKFSFLKFIPDPLNPPFFNPPVPKPRAAVVPLAYKIAWKIFIKETQKLAGKYAKMRR